MEPVIGADDWRNSLAPDSRSKIIAKITVTLRRHLPSDGEEGEWELRSIATRFENKIYDAATSQCDYLRRITLKLLTIESRAAGSSVPGYAFNAPPYDEF